jgi:uncharacterized membrane-anchored protein
MLTPAWQVGAWRVGDGCSAVGAAMMRRDPQTGTASGAIGRRWSQEVLSQRGAGHSVARGFPEIEVVRWIETPTYESATHRLIWSMLYKRKGDPDSAAKGTNYNTYALGRDGYFSLNLLTNADDVGTDKVAAHALLAALWYNPGKRYEDFNAATDHIAEYGIAALVGGVVAKKLGLFALIAAFVMKFAKVISVAVLAAGGGIWNFFRRRLRTSAAPDVE